MPFLDWYRRYQGEITWWIIGWLCFGALDCILKGDYIWAAINAGLVYVNYKFWRER